jgi:hypothetical protein
VALFPQHLASLGYSPSALAVAGVQHPNDLFGSLSRVRKNTPGLREVRAGRTTQILPFDHQAVVGSMVFERGVVDTYVHVNLSDSGSES